MESKTLSREKLKDLLKEGLSSNAILRYCKKNNLEISKIDLEIGTIFIQNEEVIKSLSSKKGGTL